MTPVWSLNYMLIVPESQKFLQPSNGVYTRTVPLPNQYLGIDYYVRLKSDSSERWKRRCCMSRLCLKSMSSSMMALWNARQLLRSDHLSSWFLQDGTRASWECAWGRRESWRSQQNSAMGPRDPRQRSQVSPYLWALFSRDLLFLEHWFRQDKARKYNQHEKNLPSSGGFFFFFFLPSAFFEHLKFFPRVNAGTLFYLCTCSCAIFFYSSGNWFRRHKGIKQGQN